MGKFKIICGSFLCFDLIITSVVKIISFYAFVCLWNDTFYVHESFVNSDISAVYNSINKLRRIET